MNEECKTLLVTGAEEQEAESVIAAGFVTRLSTRSRWRSALFALGCALVLHVLLMVTLTPTLFADDDDTVTSFGFVLARPSGATGEWVIDRTIPRPSATITVEATSSTDIPEAIVVGDCVEVEAFSGVSFEAVKIVGKDVADCSDDDDDADDGDTDDDTGDDDDTGGDTGDDDEVDDTDDNDGSGDDDGGEGDDDDRDDDDRDDDEDDRDDDDDDEFRRDREGTLAVLPLGEDLLGEWSINVGANQRLTFTVDVETRLTPASLSAFGVGRWVEVRLQQAQGGMLRAERVRVDDYELGEIVVRVESAAISDTIAAKYNLVLTSTLLNDANIYLFTTSEENERGVAARIAQEDGVIWAEVNYVNSVPEEDGYKTWGWGGKSEPDAYSSQSAYHQIRMHDGIRDYQGQGVVVAVLDTGIYTSHEQFADKLRLPSLDVIDDDVDPSEEGPGLAWGHGTHVAGVVSAMAPQATILPVRVLDENGRGNTFLLAYAIEWATQQPGVRVINLSLGTDFDSQILREVIAKAIAQGIIVVAAAGNNGADIVQYPAAYADVVAVTAVDENSVKASFANFGKGWIDLAAPGVGIMSTMINEQGPGYATWSGTSMSTAFVSGAAVLVVEKWAVSAQAVGLLDQLVATGLAVDALNPLFAGKIGRQLDVSAALDVDPMLLYMPDAEKQE